MARILVIGGRGYLGRLVVEALDEGHEVVVGSRRASSETGMAFAGVAVAALGERVLSHSPGPGVWMPDEVAEPRWILDRARASDPSLIWHHPSRQGHP